MDDTWWVSSVYEEAMDMAGTHDYFCSFHGIKINNKKSVFQVLDPLDDKHTQHLVNPAIKPPILSGGRMTTWPSGQSLGSEISGSAHQHEIRLEGPLELC